MNPFTDSPYTAYIGIDWADTKHDVCLQPAGCEQREFTSLPHQVGEIENWARSLRQRFGGPIAIALELAQGPIVYALQRHDFLVLYPIHPSTLAKYREAFTPSRAKDDPTDAELALDLLLRHPDRFPPLRPQSVELRALATLVEQRRELVSDRVRITNRLRSTLKQYYPQVLEWFDRINTPLFCDFITRWPTLEQVKPGPQKHAGTVLPAAQHALPPSPGEPLPGDQGGDPVNPGSCRGYTASIARPDPGRATAGDPAGHPPL
jgi:transposase